MGLHAARGPPVRHPCFIWSNLPTIEAFKDIFYISRVVIFFKIIFWVAEQKSLRTPVLGKEIQFNTKIDHLNQSFFLLMRPLVRKIMMFREQESWRKETWLWFSILGVGVLNSLVCVPQRALIYTDNIGVKVHSFKVLLVLFFEKNSQDLSRTVSWEPFCLSIELHRKKKIIFFECKYFHCYFVHF